MKNSVQQLKETWRLFTTEFKREAVRRMAERRAQAVRVQPIGRELDVGADMLRLWAHQLKTGDTLPSDVFPGQGRVPSDEAERRRLQREVHRLQQENSFLRSDGRALPAFRKRAIKKAFTRRRRARGTASTAIAHNNETANCRRNYVCEA